jgi:hypothetical protein
LSVFPVFPLAHHAATELLDEQLIQIVRSQLLNLAVAIVLFHH